MTVGPARDAGLRSHGSYRRLPLRAADSRDWTTVIERVTTQAAHVVGFGPRVVFSSIREELGREVTVPQSLGGLAEISQKTAEGLVFGRLVLTRTFETDSRKRKWQPPRGSYPARAITPYSWTPCVKTRRQQGRALFFDARAGTSVGTSPNDAACTRGQASTRQSRSSGPSPAAISPRCSPSSVVDPRGRRHEYVIIVRLFSLWHAPDGTHTRPRGPITKRCGVYAGTGVDAAKPFQWTFTRRDLTALLAKLGRRPTRAAA